MNNELMLYSELDEDGVNSIMSQLNWIGENSVYAVRIYCPGGEVERSWGIAAKMNELKANGCRSIAKVDGLAASMMGALLCYFDEREALDVSNIMIHRAAYTNTDAEGKPIEPSPEETQYLAKINFNLKAKMSQVIDSKKLKEIKGITIDDLFDETKERINCWLNTDEAIKVGLITKKVQLDVVTSKNMALAVTACYDPKIKATAATAGKSNNKKMTAAELKESDPECFKAIEEEAAKAALKAFKAKAKAKAAKEDDESDGDEDPEDEFDPKDPKMKGKAKAEAKVVAMAVEATLKAMGIKAIEGNQTSQTAQAIADQAAKAKADKEAGEVKASTDLKAQLEQIKSGKIA